VFGAVVSVVGISASAAFDLPTGATVVCAFGVMLLALAVVQLACGARISAAARRALSPRRRTDD
jgi:ABC-type Mn2+/Zn2+ transport system permease subunit